MIKVRIGEMDRTLRHAELRPFLEEDRQRWLRLGRDIHYMMVREAPRGAWPHSLARKLQHLVTEMIECEARIDELITLDARLP